jgi:flagellar FliL protein
MADNAERESRDAPTAAGVGKLPIILMAANSLMLAAVLALLLLRPLGGHAKPAEHATEPSPGARGDARAEKAVLPGPTVKFPDFVVHLRDAEMDRYARLAIEVEVADDKAKEGLTARLPQIRDSFIAYLSDRSTGDLRGSEAIARAKGDLTERLKAVAPGLPVRGLYVTELVVQ